MSKEIGSLSEDQVLNTSPDDLCDYFVEKHKFDPIEIDESGVTVDYGDAQIGQEVPMARTMITFSVPFSGDPDLFKYKPSTYTFSLPRGAIQGNELVFTYDLATKDSTNIRNEFEQETQNVKQYLSWIADEVEEFNSTIRQTVSEQIAARREKLLQDRGIVENLGFPLKRRSGVPRTYTSPEVRRRIVTKLPSVSSQPSKPEPTLNLPDYEHILSVISNMVLVMERSPRAFKDMGEEDLRQHFLVQLNGQYEGQATGETFNYDGKTDILIRAEGRNIFIAECKFWIGPSGLKKALDQLLGYSSWRDTSIALLIFNRDTNMSTVLQKVPEAVREHRNYKADLDYDSETGFRYVFSHRDDPCRKLTLTVLVFDIPS